MTERTQQAIQMLGTLTRHYDLWALAGNGNVRARQAVMLALTGEKLPQAKCGIGAMREMFYSACNITGDCLAAREDVFVEYCKATQSEVTA